jgi:hypothetical protein
LICIDHQIGSDRTFVPSDGQVLLDSKVRLLNLFAMVDLAMTNQFNSCSLLVGVGLLDFLLFNRYLYKELLGAQVVG